MDKLYAIGSIVKVGECEKSVLSILNKKVLKKQNGSKV